MSDAYTGILIALGIIVILFLIFREILCWYWKINERIELHKELINEIKKLNSAITNTPIVENETPYNATQEMQKIIDEEDKQLSDMELVKKYSKNL
jgi:hypothetical protein